MNVAYKYQATADYFKTLNEIDYLVGLVEDDTDEKTRTILKASILLLGGKFESFVENITEEYIYNINNICQKPSLIPLSLRVIHAISALKSVDKFRDPDRHKEAEKLFLNISNLWIDPGPSPSIEIECKFSYGRHGEDELRRLFQNIGIKDIFNEVPVIIEKESMLDDDTEKINIDFKGKFNSLMFIRNNILHEDASPSLTVGFVQEYEELFKKFANCLDNYLGSEIDKIKAGLANN